MPSAKSGTGKNLMVNLLASLCMTISQFSYSATSSANGNQLDPVLQPPAIVPDPAGLNIFQQNTRTPTGLLYRDVMKWPELKPLGAGDWQYYLTVEAGFLGASGNSKPASFIEYGDWSEGPVLNRFSALVENPRTAQYIRFNGGGIGRDDQYLQLQAGEYGKYNLKVAYDSIPHVFTTNARVLWNGSGTDNLTLPASLTPGASSLSAVQAAFRSIGDSTLALERDKATVSFSFNPNKRLNLFANGSIEWRDGSRPFGGGFTYPNIGQVMETVEPISYTTNEISTGFTYADKKYQLNFTYAGSFFSNKYSSLTWENPGLTPFATLTPEQGRFALAPDNENQNLRGDFAMSLPFWNSRFTSSLSYNQSTQNDLLIPPTISSGTIGSPPNTINFDDWNSVAALSRNRADAEVDALNLQTKITMSPMNRLNVVGELRYHDQNNHTDYTAFNPLTGEYGYITMDGGPAAFGPSLSGIYFPAIPGNRVRFRSMPFDKDTIFLKAGTDYNLADDTDVTVNYEHEEMNYSFREVDTVVDNRYQFWLTHRRMGLGTFRLSYEYTSRDGDDYNFNPYEQFYTSSLAGFIPRFPDGSNRPQTLSAMRKYDIASKDEHKVNAKFNFILNDKMDLMLSGSYVNSNYNADYGLKGSDTMTANVEWNYQFALNGSLYAFYSYQMDDRTLANIKDAGASSSNPDPGGPVYPLNRAWSEDITEKNHSIGTGLNLTHGKFTLDLNYTFLYADSRFRYSFASPAAFLNRFTLAEVGNGLPDQTFRYHLLEGNVRWSIREGTNLRFMYRFEKEDLNDFHYSGLTQPVINNNIFLLAVPENYHAHVFMVTIEKSF